MPLICSDATIVASLADSKGVYPQAIPCKKPPLKASPAPVESTTSAFLPGMVFISPLYPITHPFLPIFTATVETPLSQKYFMILSGEVWSISHSAS